MASVIMSCLRGRMEATRREKPLERRAAVAAGYLGDELVVVGQVGPAVDAAVGSVAARQVGLEGLGARHSDHGRGWRAVQKGAAGPGRLTREAPQHTGEGRGGRWGGRRTPEDRRDSTAADC